MDKNTHLDRVRRFIETGSSELEHLATAIDHGDTLTIRNRTNGLKCMAAELGLADVVSCAQMLESGATYCSMSGTVTSFDALKYCLSCVERSISDNEGTGEYP